MSCTFCRNQITGQWKGGIKKLIIIKHRKQITAASRVRLKYMEYKPATGQGYRWQDKTATLPAHSDHLIIINISFRQDNYLIRTVVSQSLIWQGRIIKEICFFFNCNLVGYSETRFYNLFSLMDNEYYLWMERCIFSNYSWAWSLSNISDTSNYWGQGVDLEIGKISDAAAINPGYFI